MPLVNIFFSDKIAHKAGDAVIGVKRLHVVKSQARTGQSVCHRFLEEGYHAFALFFPVALKICLRTTQYINFAHCLTSRI